VRPWASAIEVCAGAGGFGEGLKRTGWHVRGVENNADAVDTHRRHVGICELANVRTFTPPPAVLVAGGVPCQPFSQAGLGLGLEDDRYLVPELLRIAREADARAVLLENVRGLVISHPEAFRIVLAAFAADGWIVQWRILNAADYGVPQIRHRVFVVGFRDEGAAARFTWPEPTHAPMGVAWLRRRPYRTVREALELGLGDYDTGRKEGTKGWNGLRYLDVDHPGKTITSRNNPDLLNPLDRPASCVTATEGRSSISSTRPRRKQRRCSEILAWELAAAGLLDRPATTVAVNHRLSRAGHHGNAPGDRQQTGAVRLTPNQCAALQGFPKHWRFTGGLGSQYRQIGNAVPPALGEAVGRSVLHAIFPDEP
jgi:DNA (cytosine-5)-methyltransferase 1